jgi:hypothetical protein
VRLELKPQVLKLRFGELGRQLRGVELALARRFVTIHEPGAGCEQRIDDDVDRELHEIPDRHEPVVVVAESGRTEQHLARDPVQGRMHRGEPEDGEKMNDCSARPSHAVEWKSASHAANQGEEHRGSTDAGELLDEVDDCRFTGSPRDVVEILVQRHEEGDERRQGEPDDREPATWGHHGWDDSANATTKSPSS